jgi:hypothetical protein
MGRVAGGRALSLEEVRTAVAERLHSRRTEIEEAILARIRNVAYDPARGGDVQYEEGQRAAVVAVLDYALTGIEHGEEMARLVPSEVVAQAPRAARCEVGLDTILRRYTACCPLSRAAPSRACATAARRWARQCRGTRL